LKEEAPISEGLASEEAMDLSQDRLYDDDDDDEDYDT
jgi:hypothetical protein